MKKIFIPFVIAATTLSFAACQKEASSPAIEDELVSLNFTSANPTTKTVADAVNKTILWEKGDKISIAYTVADKWQNASGDATTNNPAKIYVSNGLAAGGETAVFNISGDFNSTATGVHQFYSVYPSSCVKSNNIKYAPSVTMTIPDIQTPAENSFDAAADLMIGKATKTYNSLSDARADAIPLLWQRIVSHADITLKGLQGLTENEVITTIVLTADADAKLVGDRYVDIQNGDISVPTKITDANILTINGTNLKVNNNNVEFWAAIMPSTVKSLNIVVETNKATYTRNIESCNIVFKQNARKGLNVDMSSVTRVEKSVGLALPFVDDFSWQTNTSSNTDISNEVSTLSKNKYNAGNKVFTYGEKVIRIGSSNNIGYISTCALDLSKDFYVEVEAKAFNPDDNAHISISVDKGTPLTATDALTSDYETYCFNLSAATASSSIKISTDTKRAVITSIKIAEGKSTYVPAPKLTISPEFVKVASDATNTTFAVTSNTKWTVSTTSDWATVATTSGENNGEVKITFSENAADTERTADIVVKTEDGSITKTFKLTQNAAGSTGINYFVKVTSAPTDWSGTYLIVYEEGNVAFDGSLTSLDAKKNTVAVTISENKTIEATADLLKSSFTIESSSKGNYAIKAANGSYIGRTTNSNGFNSGTTKMDHTLNFEKEVLTIKSASGPALKYNSNSDQLRFRYYKSGQKDIQLYKLAN